MFKVQLLYLNTDLRGRRLSVSESLAVLGRSRSSDIRLNSQSVSRKHCMLRVTDTEVTIEDLGSRNGTYVGEEKIEPNVPFPIFHHNILRIGKWGFRISIRDKATKKPLSGDSPEGDELDSECIEVSGKDLLNELDRLAESLEISPEDSTIEIPPSEGSESEETRELHQKSGDANEERTAAETSESNSQTADRQDDSNPQSGKIPKHLRPKAPVNSQSAAETALRNLFRR